MKIKMHVLVLGAVLVLCCLQVRISGLTDARVTISSVVLDPSQKGFEGGDVDIKATVMPTVSTTGGGGGGGCTCGGGGGTTSVVYIPAQEVYGQVKDENGNVVSGLSKLPMTNTGGNAWWCRFQIPGNSTTKTKNYTVTVYADGTSQAASLTVTAAESPQDHPWTQ